MIDDVYFLIHHTPPVEFGTLPKLILMLPAGTEIRTVTLQTLSEVERPIITHSFSLLIDWFRKYGLRLPKQIIDLEVAKKLLVGRPKAEYDTAVYPWDMPSLVRSFLSSRYDSVRFRTAFVTHLASPTSSNFGDTRAMLEIATKLPLLWSTILLELTEKGELTRFLEVEIPTYNLLLSMQYQGIEIDDEQRSLFLGMIEDEYVSAHHELAIGLGVDVERAFTDVNYLSSLVKTPFEVDIQPRRVIKVKKNDNQICALLYCVDKARRNRRILLRTSVSSSRCFPVYDAMGTVTGRITAVDPRLQQLNKKYRKIMKASDRTRLLYLDYSQFEPNIMASISNDESLLALCAQNDLYEQLAFNLWGKSEYRNVAKTMFLEYSYGKDERRLASGLTSLLGSEIAERTIRERFLPLFFGVHRWKVSVADALLRDGRIGTALGAHRYRKEAGELNSKECRWAVSQVVQGTGALILKKVMLTISSRLPEVQILLPMFDALLMQIPEESVQDTTAALIECFVESFREVCPAAIPAVRIKPFAAEQLASV